MIGGPQVSGRELGVGGLNQECGVFLCLHACVCGMSEFVCVCMCVRVCGKYCRILGCVGGIVKGAVCVRCVW